MRALRVAGVLVLGACWSGAQVPAAPVADAAGTRRAPVASATYRVTLRIDDEADDERVRGVTWLEHADGRRWVLAYPPPRRLWVAFVGREVLVTGACYVSAERTIDAPHFELEHLRLVAPASGTARYRAVGPTLELTGMGIGAPGARTATAFVADDGTRYDLIWRDVPLGLRVRIRGRVVVPGTAPTARSPAPDLWADTVELAADVRDRPPRRFRRPCP